MAADILLYDTTHVPVGDDQKQHLELTREIANKFNLDFDAKDFFKSPEPLIQKNFSRIMSLKDGAKKMSKSDDSDFSRINLKDTKDNIINKIKKAKTDALEMPKSENDLNQRSEVKNLFGIYASLNNQKITELINEFKDKNFSDFKNKLTDLLVEKISPISSEISRLQNDAKYIDQILQKGSERANEISSKKVNDMKKILGF